MIDLRGIPAREMRIKGISFHDIARYNLDLERPEYVLLREPKNKHDPNAIAVYSEGRKIGYVARSAAKLIAPEMDRLSQKEALVSSGRGRLTIMIPRAAALRAARSDAP